MTGTQQIKKARTKGAKAKIEDDSILQAVVALEGDIASLENNITKIKEQLGVLKEALKEEERWVRLSKAVRVTGMRRNAMIARIKDGRWLPGKHYRNTSDGCKPFYIVNLKAVEELLNKPPEKRPPAKS